MKRVLIIALLLAWIGGCNTENESKDSPVEDSPVEDSPVGIWYWFDGSDSSPMMCIFMEDGSFQSITDFREGARMTFIGAWRVEDGMRLYILYSGIEYTGIEMMNQDEKNAMEAIKEKLADRTGNYFYSLTADTLTIGWSEGSKSRYVIPEWIGR